MPKRKRGEASLEEKLAKWQKELVRALKLAKGFERQRLSKRLRDADLEKKARLEREVLVLKVSFLVTIPLAFSPATSRAI